MKFHLTALSLLASAFPIVQGSLRGVIDIENGNDARNLGEPMVAWYNETLGDCTGALCSVFGDPHVITCDGLAYDCQAVGVFTIMDNHMFNIQGHFVAIKEENIPGHIKVGGSLFNDAMIEFKGDDSVPILQLGFGDVSEQIDEFPSTVGCTVKKYWEPRKQYKRICGENPEDITIDANCHTNGVKHGDNSVYKCRERCQKTPGCAKFNYWADEKCEMYYDDANLIDQPGSWNLNLAGTMDSECGMEHPMPELKVEAERLFHGSIGKNKQQECPLLMYLDKELQDISKFVASQKGYLHGDENSAFSVFIDRQDVMVKYTTSLGDIAQMKFYQGGAGPGEKWGCNWSFRTCLPASEEAEFKAGGRGILGSPDGNSQNDWMDVDGTVLEILHTAQDSYDYCNNNWCVEQEDIIMAMPGDWTLNDVMCQHLEYKEFDINDPDCVLSADVIIDSCADVPEALRYACELDCCMGGCAEMQETIGDIFIGVTLGEEDIQYDIPNHDQCSDEDGLFNTGETVCPGSAESIVSILQIAGSGGDDLPGASELIYGIVTDIEPNANVDGKNVRFRVNNPFGSNTDIYVQHDKNAFVDGMLEPKCEPLLDVGSGCDTTSQKIEVACRNNHGDIDSFALFHVYITSSDFPSSDVTIDQCCKPETASSNFGGVIHYTFTIQCECPSTSATE